MVRNRNCWFSHAQAHIFQMSKLRPVAIDARPDTRTEIDRLDPDETVDYQLPVMMEGEPSEIWVNEVEK